MDGKWQMRQPTSTRSPGPLRREHRTRFVCLGETPSPRVRCQLALLTYLLTTYGPEARRPRTRPTATRVRACACVCACVRAPRPRAGSPGGSGPLPLPRASVPVARCAGPALRHGRHGMVAMGWASQNRKTPHGHTPDRQTPTDEREAGHSTFQLLTLWTDPSPPLARRHENGTSSTPASRRHGSWARDRFHAHGTRT